MSELPPILRWAMYHFGSGDAFFVAQAFFALAIFAAWRRWPGRRVFSIAFVGALWLGLSAWPGTLFWILGLGICVAANHLHLRLRRVPGKSCSRLLPITLAFVAIAPLHETAFRLTPRVPLRSGESLAVIGDSVTAGLNDDDTWPQQLSRRCNITVWDASQPGATLPSALQQLTALDGRGDVLILEIGGNDLLEEVGVAPFREALQELLSAATQRYNRVVMCELPLPPLSNQYGFWQRRLAGQYRVLLIPKRRLIGILTTAGATVDGVHLSDAGQTRMTELMQLVLHLAPGTDEKWSYHRVE